MQTVPLVLIRHGESQWNRENRFTGWMDIDLSERGISEAQKAGVLIRQSGINIERAFTSFLLRAVKTLWLVQEHSGFINIPVTPAWELNERHYGALTGLNKTETAEKYGEEQVKIWRRSYATRPPLLAPEDTANPALGERYRHLSSVDKPLGESLADTEVRVKRYFENYITRHLCHRQAVLIAAHGNSLRALIKYLEQMSAESILELNIPTGVPIVYELAINGKTLSVASKKILGQD